MNFLHSLKKAYFVATTLFTSIIMIGGYIIIIKNSNASSVSWAQELIAICLALWVPSPVDFIKKTTNKTRAELLNTTTTATANSASQFTQSNTIDEESKRAIEHIMINANDRNYQEPARNDSFASQADIENQLLYARNPQKEQQSNLGNEDNIEQINTQTSEINNKECTEEITKETKKETNAITNSCEVILDSEHDEKNINDKNIKEHVNVIIEFI